jgi:hypothetical protein
MIPKPPNHCTPKVLERLTEGKAVSIAAAFTCTNAIVMCSDTLITYQGSHKSYEHKVFPHQGVGWSVVFGYSGSPGLMKGFDDSFSDAMYSIEAPISAATVEQQIKSTLSGMDSVQTQENLSMLCGIAIPNGEKRLLMTEGKDTHRIPNGFVGIGDKSVVHYLSVLLIGRSSGTCTIRQAELLGIYLIQQAKNWVDGCGGDTDVIILRSDGRIEPSSKIIQSIEGRFGLLERHFSDVAVGFLDERISDEEFDRRLRRFSQVAKEERATLT